MSTKQYSEKTLSLAIFISAALWGLYWIPLRAIENMGISTKRGQALKNGTVQDPGIPKFSMARNGIQ